MFRKLDRNIDEQRTKRAPAEADAPRQLNMRPPHVGEALAIPDTIVIEVSVETPGEPL